MVFCDIGHVSALDVIPQLLSKALRHRVLYSYESQWKPRGSSASWKY